MWKWDVREVQNRISRFQDTNSRRGADGDDYRSQVGAILAGTKFSFLIEEIEGLFLGSREDEVGFGFKERYDGHERGEVLTC